MVNSRDKGARFEVAVANYLKPTWPEVERAVRAGYHTSSGRVSIDPGDLSGTRYVCWSLKDVASAPQERPAEFASWLAELEAMQTGWRAWVGRPVGVLLVKRHRYTDVGMSWAYLTALDYARLQWETQPLYVPPAAVIRFQFAQLLPALQHWESVHRKGTS